MIFEKEMKYLTKKECLACMQRSRDGKYCWYHDKLFVQMVEDDGNTQYWKDCDVSDAERLP